MRDGQIPQARLALWVHPTLTRPQRPRPNGIAQTPRWDRDPCPVPAIGPARYFLKRALEGLRGYPPSRCFVLGAGRCASPGRKPRQSPRFQVAPAERSFAAPLVLGAEPITLSRAVPCIFPASDPL